MFCLLQNYPLIAYKVKISTNYEKIIQKFVIPFIAHARRAPVCKGNNSYIKGRQPIYNFRLKLGMCKRSFAKLQTKVNFQVIQTTQKVFYKTIDECKTFRLYRQHKRSVTKQQTKANIQVIQKTQKIYYQTIDEGKHSGYIDNTKGILLNYRRR